MCGSTWAGSATSSGGLQIDAFASYARPTGAELIVRFDPAAGGPFGPTLQVVVRGSLGSVAFVSVPHVHHGKAPEHLRRRDEVIQWVWYEAAFPVYLPRGLPLRTRLQYAAHAPGGGYLYNLVMPGRRGWVSLIVVERGRCPRAGAATPLACFRDIVGPASETEVLELAGQRWQIGRVGAAWAAATQLPGVTILVTAADRQLVLRAAASTGPRPADP